MDSGVMLMVLLVSWGTYAEYKKGAFKNPRSATVLWFFIALTIVCVYIDLRRNGVIGKLFL